MACQKVSEVFAYTFETNALSERSRATTVTVAQLETLIHALRQHLPGSIALLRQLELYPGTPTSVILSSFPLSTFPLSPLFPPSFALGLFDRAGSPGVECWVYTHLDVVGSSTDRAPSQLGSATDQAYAEAANHLLALFSRLAKSPYGANIPSALTGKPSDNPNHLLVGVVSAPVRAVMVASPALSHMMRDDLYTAGGPYAKFIFPLSGMTELLQKTPLPDGLVWGEVTEADYPRVMASNDIMKMAAMIRGLPSAALRLPASAGGEMVAWGFIGPNACVRALYCAGKWRGRGLARLIVARLHTVAGSLLEGVKDGFGHADASETNTGSVRVFESLGAKKERSYYWLRVDLDRLPGQESSILTLQ